MTKNIIKLFFLTLLINGSIAIASEREMQIYATVKTRPVKLLAMLKDAQDLELAIRSATQHNVPLAKELLNHSSLKLSQEQIKEGAICAACVNDDVELFNILFSRLEAQYRMECVNRALDRAAYNEHPAMVQHLVTRKDIVLGILQIAVGSK